MGRENSKMKIYKTDGRGFSLAEVIFVIAIATFLACVTVPLLLKYVEKTKVTADAQMVDSVKMMVTVALSEPKVTGADEPGIPEAETWLNLSSAADFQGAFGEAVAQRLGYDNAALMTDPDVGITSKLQMKNASIITVTIDEDGCCTEVTIWSEDGRELLSVH